MSLTADKHLAKLSVALIKRRPFYGHILTRLEGASADKSVSTACASATSIWYNPEFIESLTEAEANFVFLHELYHIALRHAARANYRNHQLWNVACDLTINAFLDSEISQYKDARIEVSRPEDALFAPSRDILEMTTEQVYADLLESLSAAVESQTGTPLDVGSGCPISSPVSFPFHGTTITLEPDALKNGDLLDAPIDSEELERITAEIQNAARQFSASAGSSILRDIARQLKRKIPWYRILSRFMEASLDGDPSFATPDKNFLWSKKILPGTSLAEDPTVLSDILVCIDTSGSISDTILKDCQAQLEKLLRDYEMTATVIYWSVGIDATFPLETSTDLVKLKPSSRGGTCWKTTSEEILERFGNNHTALINFTDGCFSIEGCRRLKNSIFVLSDDAYQGDTSQFNGLGKVATYTL